MTRVLIADDEPIALERLELAIAGVPEMRLIEKARNGKQALQLIRALKPDLAILDIEMPGLDGLAVVEALDLTDIIPEIIFVTAFQDYAIRAFEMHATDYMLKPVDFTRFRETMNLVMGRAQGRAAESKLVELQAMVASLRSEMSGDVKRYDDDLWVRGRSGLQRIPVQDIQLILADGDYVQLHVNDASHLHRDTIAALEMRLNPAHFLRVHRCAIVQKKAVASLRRKGPRKIFLSLSSGQLVPVGPSYTGKVVETLHARAWR